jgi:predicted phage terminase large subunit-like protein
MILQPQEGPQAEFLACGADVVFYGGAAGSGKTMALTLEPLHYLTKVKGFTCVIFRRTYPEITSPGGLWDESSNVYPLTGAKENRSQLRWTWKNGSSVKFAHMQHDKDVHAWQGSQIALICFDELTHFSMRQFFYMLSRNRSGCGVRPYIRCTMNPDPDSWVREFIAWYLDQDGNPIVDRGNVIRFFARKGDKIEWRDTAEELVALGMKPKSFTFIPATVQDNKILLSKDPDYLANLEALLPHERARLLGGNWDARPTAGSYFRREWCQTVDVAPAQFDDEVTYWDRAATVPSPTNPSPDATIGIHMRRKGGLYYICDMRKARETPGKVQELIVNTASSRPSCTVVLEEDPGQAGKADVATLITALNRFRVEVRRVTKAKDLRLRPFSTQAQAGNVKIVRGPWNNEYFNVMEGFPEGDHDDECDGTSGAYNYLTENLSSMTQKRF